MLDIFKKLIGDKKEYRQMMARVKAMPDDFRYVFEKMQSYMWMFASGDGMDILQIHYELIDLFESAVAEGKTVLEVTGDDVAEFCDELLRSANTYTSNWHDKLNNDIMKKLKKHN